MIKKLLLLIALTVTMALPFGAMASAQDAQAGTNTGTNSTNAATPAPASSLFSGSKDAACGGAQAQDNPVTCDAGSGQKINDMISAGLNAFSILIGIAAVIMIMIAGFKFITSQGESANIASARNTILYAIIGLVVVALSQFIVRFVLTKASPKPVAPATTTFQEVKSLEVTPLYVV